MPSTTTVDHTSIASNVYNRMSDAAGETGMQLWDDPTWAEDYGQELVELIKRMKRDEKLGHCLVDGPGSVADTVFNHDDFWDMARDWIHDGLLEAKVDFNDHDLFRREYAEVCRALAKIANFKRDLILGWIQS